MTLPAVQVLILDMDGTLTRRNLDFDAIRAELGLPAGPLLETMEQLAPAERARAEQVLLAHELRAARDSQLQDGAVFALRALRQRGVRLALLTRNCRASVQTVLSKHGLAESFDLVWTREDGPTKPSPRPVVQICQRLGVSPRRAWVVGDGLFDLLAGKAAGARTALMVAQGQEPDYADQADRVIRRLGELAELIEA